MRDLAASALGEVAPTAVRDAELDALRKERDDALATARRGEADLLALRSVTQRLMVENTRLLGSGSPPVEDGSGYQLSSRDSGNDPSPGRPK